MRDDSIRDVRRIRLDCVSAAIAVVACVSVAFVCFGLLCAALVAAMAAVVWRTGSTGDVTRFSLRAVLVAIPVWSFAFVVRIVLPSPFTLQSFGLLYAAAVALTIVASRTMGRERGGQETAERRMAAFDGILLGVVLGGFGGVGTALLHAVVHAPAPVPNQPLANEWWTAGVGICALASGVFGALIGVVIAAAPSVARRWAAFFAVSGAAAGLLAGYFSRTTSEGIGLILGCFYSTLGAAIAVAMVMLRGLRGRPRT